MSRKSKLAALAADPAATVNERTVAQRLLDNIANDETEHLLICVKESWEIALLEMLAVRHNLTPKLGLNGFVEVGGSPTALDMLIIELIRLHPKLEDIVISATAGFLAAHFPPEGQRSSSFEDPVQAAARRSAKTQVAGPKQLTENTVRRIAQQEP